MSALEGLIASAGGWRGTSTLEDPHTGSSDASPSTLAVIPVLGGSFVRLDYTWAHRDAPQAGSLLVGHDPTQNVVTAHWIDSWHMGRKVMACVGPTPTGSTLSVRGGYVAPPGPDWGWRIDVMANGGRTLQVVMFNVPPGGRDELAVEATYTRAP
jgi:hypothetical protein